jgi:ABC-type amino acid transport substrate-binding protein
MDKYLAAYNKQLADLVNDGTFLKLYRKYFPGVDYPSSLFQYWPSLRTQVQNEPAAN